METIYKGFKIVVEADDFATNPLEWCGPEDRGAMFVMNLRGWDLPNEAGIDFDEFDNWHDVAEKVLKENDRFTTYKFVRWHEHGGIVVSLRDDAHRDDWDAGTVGVI